MQFSTLAIASLLSLASARIVGIAVPKTIRPGDGINAIILTEGYIQSVADVAIAFGVTPGAGYPGTLGTTLQSYYLGPEQSNTQANITKYINAIPASLAPGAATFSASLFSLYGASSSATLSNYNVSVTIANATSSEYVSSIVVPGNRSI